MRCLFDTNILVYRFDPRNKCKLWSFAEFYQIERIYSEDFQDQRIYGSVRIVNPFEE